MNVYVPDNVASDQFEQELQAKIVEPLLTLVAIALELPEDYLTNIHRYEVKSEVSHWYCIVRTQKLICRRITSGMC
jgi:hypothetical protein